MKPGGKLQLRGLLMALVPDCGMRWAAQERAPALAPG
jgi:hypothetical protein